MGFILPFPKKGDLGLAKNYLRYNPCIHSSQDIQCNRIEPKTENIRRKNQNGFRRNTSTTSQIFDYPSNSWRCTNKKKKKLEETILFVDFTKAFDSIHRRKMEQILLAYGLRKEAVYRNTKVKVRSSLSSV